MSFTLFDATGSQRYRYSIIIMSLVLSHLRGWDLLSKNKGSMRNRTSANSQLSIHLVYGLRIFIKIIVFPYIMYCGGQHGPPQYKMYGKGMIFKMKYFITYKCNFFEILKQHCRPPYLLMIWFPGATIIFVRETIRIMNMCHSCKED